MIPLDSIIQLFIGYKNPMG